MIIKNSTSYCNLITHYFQYCSWLQCHMQLVPRQHCKKVEGTFPAAAPSARSLWTFSYKLIAVIAKQLDCLVYCCFNNAASQHAKLDAPRAGLNPGKPESDVLLREHFLIPMLAARLIGQRVISIHMLAVGVRVSPSGRQGRGRGRVRRGHSWAIATGARAIP